MLFDEDGPFFHEHFFSFWDGGLAFQAQGEVFLHFLDGHVAVFEACEALDPGNVLVVKDAAVPGIPFDAGNKADVAVKFRVS